MRTDLIALWTTIIGTYSSLAAAVAPESIQALSVRALPNAPDGYTPAEASCGDSRPTVRSAATLSQNENLWLEKRRQKTTDAMKDFFGRVTIAGFDARSYIENNAKNISALPNVGIAVSGGGYRALMNGGGALKAFDSRTKNSTGPGQLGGLLQSATYLSGLSGGGWLVGSLYINNLTSVSELEADEDGSVWEFNNSILEGPTQKGIKLLNTVDYYKEIYDAVEGKKKAGFDVSLTDYWGRALSYQLIDAPEGGPAYTWSSISLGQDFKDGSMPLPILVADGRNPGELFIGGNATVFEFNPWEFGTFDPTIFGFMPLEFLGSKFESGSLPRSEPCVRGFDNAGYVMGTSSSLFNQFLLNLNGVDVPGFVKDAFESILESIGRSNNDIAAYDPNPFFHYSNHTSPFAKEKSLNLVDGGEDLQNIPLHPLIQPERHVDVIFAVDSSADNKFNWPNGTALVATYERSITSSIANGTVFPAVPDVNTFVNLGLNKKPTFFGCDSANMTGPSPLIVYIPNSPYVTFSNASTFQMEYSDSQRFEIIQNGYNVVTMGNGTVDSDWPTCVGCAMLSRSFERTNTQVPEACKKCFKTHCWDGRINSTVPSVYEPGLLLGPLKTTSIASSSIAPYSFTLLIAVGVAAMLL
ncbi:lysophospholipase Plb1 [Histoplasma capsulatum G186AR]|uniref:Lysophospholipase n=2 Tax=Ajellomyces capsulatus TaxID=5037 RepID=C0P1D1_AJECG|nr:lysophospholipase Plb1 [Histoplasma capsulatum G186AR]EEH02551.1 lysophospholipase Plb1 [Histoplasma capsulatum G186AR]KAG5287819.1 lysophospholipase Plb1 [Histoplasma capsulatum]QSS70387.1 lysophospholipase Plb1 [Histoplasma capsulatum G186AR]